MRVLFLGESPPASGRFFYQADSGLYRAMREAFTRIDPAFAGAGFLAAFAASGCYLLDLCPEPVDDLAPAARRAACRAGEPALSRAVVRLQPLTIVTVVRSIEANVKRAAAHAGWTGVFLHLPYPGRWVRHRERFVDTLAAKLKELPGGLPPYGFSRAPGTK